MIAKDMMDRQSVKSTIQEYIYRCEKCGFVLARTEVPMSEEGIEAKKRMHKCH